MEQDFNLLSRIYSDTSSLSKTMNCILPKVINPNIRKVLIGQINECDKINSDAKCAISNLGKKIKNNPFLNLSAAMNSKVNTIANTSDSAVAEFIIKEVNADIIDITKTINASQNSSPESYELGRKLIRKGEECISSIKIFL